MARPRILLIEDDGPSADVLKMMLEMGSFEVEVCTRASDCLRALSTNLYDAAIVDMMLPDMDTDTFVAALEQVNLLPPIIIHSARPIHELRGYANRLEAFGFLQKPVTMSVLLDQVASAVASANIRS
jgi:DNA-binding response OmpR family regulator